MIALAIVLGVLLLLALLPVGVLFCYDTDITVWATARPLRIRVYPQKPKTPAQEARAKAKREKKKAEKDAKKLIKTEEKKPEKSLKEKLAELKPFAQLAVDALGSLRHRLLIRELTVRAVLAMSDPAKTGEYTGLVWAGIGAIEPILDHSFRIRKRKLSVTPDFIGSKTTITACISVRLLVCELVAIAVKYGIRAIRMLLKENKQGKAVKQ